MFRSKISLCVAFGFVVFATCATFRLAAAAQVVLKPGQKQLFLDGAVIGQLDGVQTNVHQVEKCGPVVLPDTPWGDSILIMRDSPIWNPQLSRWEIRYNTTTTIPDHYMCMAVSSDGVNWTKPNLGLYSYNGSTENNIIGYGDEALSHTVYDPDDPNPQRRWKSLIGKSGSIWPAASPDGINWTHMTSQPLTMNEGSHLVYDGQSRQFIYTARITDGNGYRATSLSTSKDFVNWTTPQWVMSADAVDQAIAVTWLNNVVGDPTMRQPWVNIPSQYHAEIYNMGVIPYEGLYIGTPTMFRITGRSGLAPSDDGYSVPGLAVSRDLKTWSRVDPINRPDFIPISPLEEGVYDNGENEAPCHAIVHGDELWFYYTGIRLRYGPNNAPYNPDNGAINLAKLRLDGFVSADAGTSGGTLLTQPLIWHGSSLWVNADADAGRIRVEVLDADGQPLGPEYLLADSMPITSNGVRVPVQWQSGSNMRNLIGEKIRLRFHLENAGLYSFWSEGAKPVVYDDFEDGNYTNKPVWTHTTGNGTVSVETDTGGSESLAMKVVTGSSRSDLLYSTEFVDDSNAFEITLQEHCAVASSRLALQFGSLDGSNYVEFEWSGGSTGIAPRMDLYVQANGVFQQLSKTGTTIGGLKPGDDVLHTITLGRKADETCYVYVDDGSLCSLELKNTSAFNNALEQLRFFVNAQNAAYPVTMFLDNIEFTTPSDLPGDANGDNKVDTADATILAANWLSGPGANWTMGDFNDDGVVDDKDASLMAANWHAGVETGSVPEPSCLVLLIGAALTVMLLFYRKLNVV